jgi:putative nucleotidyltransferase with HDIG domain
LNERGDSRLKGVGKELALRMLTLFSGAVKGMAFYPESHPAIRQPLLALDRMLAASLNQVSTVTWGIIDGIIFFEKHLFITHSTAVADLTSRMMEKGIGRIVVSSGVTLDELQRFVLLFSSQVNRFDELCSGMARAGVSHIQLFSNDDMSVADEPGDAEEMTREGGFMAAYGQALDAIRGVCRDIEQGRIPASAPVIRAVDRMVEVTMQEPSTLLGLTMIKDYDNYTFNHCVNVGVLAMALGAALGMDAPTVRELGIAGQLHDIGKTMIPKAIINKPGKLSSAEFQEMKRHSELGSRIISEMEGLSPRIARIVLEHHLHFDHSGYPERAREMPSDRLADIVAIADTYDAITTLRVYQHPINPRAALTEMQKLTGTILDGGLMVRFMELMGKYPVGTLVRLDTNEVAVVDRPNPLDEEAPVIMILFDRDGTRLGTPREQKLVEQDGTCYAAIVAVVDPLLKNVDVGSLITSGRYA